MKHCLSPRDNGRKRETNTDVGIHVASVLNDSRSPVCWSEVGDSQLTGPEMVRETTEKIVSPWKGVIRFGKRGKLSPRYIGPFKIIERIGPVAYKLELPDKLHGIHNTLQVSKLNKSLGGLKTWTIPLEEIQLDDTLHLSKNQ
ncbi:hypothetical protein Tco_1335818 [Tanacetum coccineum]